jgi:hypothetical protein
MIAACILLAAVMAAPIASLGVRGWAGGATLGFLIRLGPAVAIGFTAWLASDRRLGIFIIDWAYQLVFLVMNGAILGAWR